MKYSLKAAVAAALIIGPVAAQAQQTIAFEPIPQEGATVRYDRGIPTVDLHGKNGAVQITPLGLDHGRLTFDVAVLNTGKEPTNFGTGDIVAESNGMVYSVLTREKLDRMARNRAVWSQVGVALLAGAVAVAAASSTESYSVSGYGPRGWYRSVVTQPSFGGQIVAAGAVVGGGYTIANIQQRLDGTRAMLAHEILQRTTIDPDSSYGGRIVLDKLKKARWPQDVKLNVRFNGEDYPVAFRVVRAD